MYFYHFKLHKMLKKSTTGGRAGAWSELNSKYNSSVLRTIETGTEPKKSPVPKHTDSTTKQDTTSVPTKHVISSSRVENPRFGRSKRVENNVTFKYWVWTVDLAWMHYTINRPISLVNSKRYVLPRFVRRRYFDNIKYVSEPAVGSCPKMITALQTWQTSPKRKPYCVSHRPIRTSKLE